MMRRRWFVGTPIGNRWGRASWLFWTRFQAERFIDRMADHGDLSLRLVDRAAQGDEA